MSGRHLDRDEEVIATIRRSLWSQAHQVLLALAWLLAPFFFFFPLVGIGRGGFVIFATLLVSGIWYALRHLVMWRRTLLIITQNRALDVVQIGLLKHTSGSIVISDIKTVKLRCKQWPLSALNIGDILIVPSAKGEKRILVRGIKYPERVKELISELQYLAQGKEYEAKG